jgi:hypothetical protein
MYVLKEQLENKYRNTGVLVGTSVYRHERQARVVSFQVLFRVTAHLIGVVVGCNVAIMMVVLEVFWGGEGRKGWKTCFLWSRKGASRAASVRSAQCALPAAILSCTVLRAA